MTPWRLFLDSEHSGAHNMAVDEAMLLAHARELALPTLRFYGWNPACLSLGRLQKQVPDGLTPETTDFDTVRRPTGGRAVWHAQEITYCAVVSAKLLPPDSRSVTGAYAWLSAGFLRGLQNLGLSVKMAPSGVRTGGANCFSASAGCDFLADGKKLIGAAQCRKEDAILQHGSLLLSIDPHWQRAGGNMDEATSLTELGLDLGREIVIGSLCDGFAAQAGAEWENRGLSGKESELAQLLSEEKYRDLGWTFGAKIADSLPSRLDHVVR